MKKSLLIILSTTTMFCYSQKDDCDKYFKKEKKSKKESSMFSDNKLVQTKFVTFFNEYKRDIGIQFKKTDKNYIVFHQQTMDNLAGKRPIKFSTAIKIGLKFEGGESCIITFESNETINTNIGDMHSSSNETLIDTKLSDLLKSKLIMAVEILNPCNDGNQSKTISQQISKKDSEIIMSAYNCILLK